MKEISLLSLPSARAVLLGDFLHGRMSVRPLTPIGADGRRTARRCALAGGGGLLALREYMAAAGGCRGRGGRPCGLASILSVESCGAWTGGFPISSGFRRRMDNAVVRLDGPDGRDEIGMLNL